MTTAEHCILVQLEGPIDQSSGLDRASLDAYKDSLHEFVWDALEPLAVPGGFHIPRERWVFEVEDPAGGDHATDVVLGGLDPDLFRRLLAKWTAMPFRAALDAAARVPAAHPGYRREDIERLWAEPDEVEDAFSEASLAERRRGFHPQDDLTAPDWAEDAYYAHKLARGSYHLPSRFFSLAHDTAKLTDDQRALVEANPASYALVFVTAKR